MQNLNSGRHSIWKRMLWLQPCVVHALQLLCCILTMGAPEATLQR